MTLYDSISKVAGVQAAMHSCSAGAEWHVGCRWCPQLTSLTTQTPLTHHAPCCVSVTAPLPLVAESCISALPECSSSVLLTAGDPPCAGDCTAERPERPALPNAPESIAASLCPCRLQVTAPLTTLNALRALHVVDFRGVHIEAQIPYWSEVRGNHDLLLH